VRPVLHGDVVSAARVLLAAPDAERGFLMKRLQRAAEVADVFRTHAGKNHPLFGDGTLASACGGRAKAPEPYLDDPDYCHCMLLVFQCLLNPVRKTCTWPRWDLD